MMHNPGSRDLNEAPAPEPVGLYTETLARLYLRQGFVAQALGIYRHVVQEQPENRRLWDQIEALEQHIATTARGEAEAPEAVLPAEARTAVFQPRLEPTQQVIEQLERWLRHLQRRRMA